MRLDDEKMLIVDVAARLLASENVAHEFVADGAIEWAVAKAMELVAEVDRRVEASRA